MQRSTGGTNDTRSVTILCVAFVLAVAAGLLSPLHAVSETGDTLLSIKTRDELRCGVSDGVLGFSTRDASGRWSGMDVDFCRAVAAVALGDPEKVLFVPLSLSGRMAALKMGNIDLLVRNTTWTMEREAVLGILFTGILYYAGQGFIVPEVSTARDLPDLNGAKICVIRGSTHEQNLRDLFANKKMTVQPVLVKSQTQAANAMIDGRCQAFTSEEPQLAAVRLLTAQRGNQGGLMFAPPVL